MTNNQRSCLKCPISCKHTYLSPQANKTTILVTWNIVESKKWIIDSPCFILVKKEERPDPTRGWRIQIVEAIRLENAHQFSKEVFGDGAIGSH